MAWLSQMGLVSPLVSSHPLSARAELFSVPLQRREPRRQLRRHCCSGHTLGATASRLETSKCLRLDNGGDNNVVGGAVLLGAYSVSMVCSEE
jgi:hypothetical protein